MHKIRHGGITMSQASNHKLLGELTDRIDRWIVPVAFGTLSVLVSAQLLTSFGPIRAYVDRVEGRFYQQPAAVIPSSVGSETASLNLYLSPATQRPDVAVILNGKPIARFVTSTELTVVVREGDKLQVESNGQGIVYVSVDDDNENLLLPAPGQTFEITQDTSVINLPTVTFTH
jgi:hypothetical protein